MFQPVSSKVDFPSLEEHVLQIWRERDVFRRTWTEREGSPLFILYEGPPTANGTPGIHHVLARIFKDVIPRYKTMKGFRPFRKGGWDTHGLPVELEVEKELNITSKGEIEAYGIEQFNARCRQSVMRYVKEWEELTERIGFWIDMDDPYVTFHNSYIETGWSILKQLWDQDLLYQGYKVTPHCPRCVTSLSSHELSLGYRDDTPDPSIYVRFPLHPEHQPLNHSLATELGWDSSTNTWSTIVPSILAWTTTPWTLTANTGLVVSPEAEYVLAVSKNDSSQEKVILAKERFDEVLGEEWGILHQFPGNALAGVEYVPPYENVWEHNGNSFFHHVLTADFVSMDDGTGVVHTAPAYGAEDQELGQANDLPTVHTVDLQGKLVGDFPGAGTFVKQADLALVDDLSKRDLLFREGTILHTYPFCWRCETPLLYYAKPSWYIRTTAIKDQLVKTNQQINWYPGHIQEGRFGEWLRNNVDWAISRERYWGTPIPIWCCRNCTFEECIGSVEELASRSTAETRALLDSDDYDLHRPYVDNIFLSCPKCNGVMERVPEVTDCWFDSGAMPYAQFHFPIENETLLTDGRFPADYICEAIDQTRGWFYSLHALAILLHGKPAYQNVICLGLILDENGEKMSKSRQNVIDPGSLISSYGADAIRWSLFTGGTPGNARRFSEKLVEDCVRRFFLTLWNTYSFFVTYANLDGYSPSASLAHEPISDMDRWITSELQTLIQDVTVDMDQYNPTDAGRRIEGFVEILSTWYIRRSRRRFWKSENDSDKESAYSTLYTCLVTLCKLLAPLTPFLAEEMYQNLVCAMDPSAPNSVHLERFPEVDSSKIDPTLANETRLIMRIVSQGRSTRSKAGVKVRQPLSEIIVKLEDKEEQSALLRLKNQVEEELNVKSVRIISESLVPDYLSLRLNTSLLGPKLRNQLSDLQELFRTADQAELFSMIRQGKSVTIGDFSVAPEEVEIILSENEQIVGVLDGPYYVGINTVISDVLAKEGLAREFVHRVQNMRRSAGFSISDRISITFQGATEIEDLVKSGTEADYIMQETLATHITIGPHQTDDYVESHRVDNLDFTLGLQRDTHQFS